MSKRARSRTLYGLVARNYATFAVCLIAIISVTLLVWITSMVRLASGTDWAALRSDPALAEGDYASLGGYLDVDGSMFAITDGSGAVEYCSSAAIPADLGQASGYAMESVAFLDSSGNAHELVAYRSLPGSPAFVQRVSSSFLIMVPAAIACIGLAFAFPMQLRHVDEGIAATATSSLLHEKVEPTRLSSSNHSPTGTEPAAENLDNAAEPSEPHIAEPESAPSALDAHQFSDLASEPDAETHDSSSCTDEREVELQVERESERKVKLEAERKIEHKDELQVEHEVVRRAKRQAQPQEPEPASKPAAAPRPLAAEPPKEPLKARRGMTFVRQDLEVGHVIASQNLGPAGSTDLCQFIRSVVAEGREDFEHAGITQSIDIASGPLWVMASPESLAGVFEALRSSLLDPKASVSAVYLEATIGYAYGTGSALLAVSYDGPLCPREVFDISYLEERVAECQGELHVLDSPLLGTGGEVHVVMSRAESMMHGSSTR